MHAPEDSAVTAHYFEEAVTNGLEEINAPKIFYELRADELPRNAPYPKG